MITFLSSFASYLLKMIILIAVALLGGVIGVTLRKKKNSKEETIEQSEVSSEN